MSPSSLNSDPDLPERQESSTLLPAPDEPMMAVNLPGCSSPETWCRNSFLTRVPVTLRSLNSNWYIMKCNVLVYGRGIAEWPWYSGKHRRHVIQDFMTTLEPLTLNKKDEIETKFDKALGTVQCFLDPTCKENDRGSLTAQKCLEDIQGSLGRARILYQDLFSDPSLHNQARRRISWRRWLRRQVNGSHLEKT